MPITSGSSIQSASAVPACAHWVAVRTSLCRGARARRVSSHGAAWAKKDREATAVHVIGSAESATMAGAEASTTAPNATPTTIPVVRYTADWPINGATSDQVPSTPGDATSTPAATTATDI